MKVSGGDHEELMLRAYEKSIELLRKYESSFIGDPNELPLGLEDEFSVVDIANPACQISTGKLRDQLIIKKPERRVMELGMNQIETHTQHQDIFKPEGLMALIQGHLKVSNDLVNDANQLGAKILRCGINPFVRVDKIMRTADVEKYKVVPDYYTQRRNPEAITQFGLGGAKKVVVENGAIPSILNAFQLNMQASSFEHAIEMVNLGMMLSPYLVAVSGNSALLQGMDTGYNDLRFLLWENNFDIRTAQQIEEKFTNRVGLPERYYSDIWSYLERMKRFPFILNNPDNALAIAVGMNYGDLRIKFLGDYLNGGRGEPVVELRTFPIQPNAEDEIGLALLFVGMVHFGWRSKRELMNFELLKRNRNRAMAFGLNSDLYSADTQSLIAARKAVEIELNYGLIGLREMGIAKVAEPYTNRIFSRLERNSGSPTDLLRRNLPWVGGSYTEEQILIALQTSSMVH